MDKRPTLLLAVMFGGGAGHEEAAVQMHGDDGQPVVLGHLVENHIAQDAGVVHHGVDAAEMVHRGLHDLLRRTPGGDRLGANFRDAALLVDHRLGLFRRAGRATLPRQ